jgi:glycosyltransferase
MSTATANPDLISIVTATYNAASTLQNCITSVAEQHVTAEHIIIDGASSDETLNLIKKHRSLLGQCVSEPDRGIYDAMNKGISCCNGEIIGILNADDFYPSPHVLSWVSKAFSDPSVDACYGDLQYVDAKNTEKVTRYWKSDNYNIRRFYHGWMPPHPTFFVRRSVYERFGRFRLEFGTAADYELMLRFLVRYRISAKYIPHVMVKMRGGGASNASVTNRIKANRMDRKAWAINGLTPYPWTLWAKPLRKIRQYWILTRPHLSQNP